MARRRQLVILICAFFALLTAACNLNNSQVIQETLTLQASGTITRTGQPTLTPNTTQSAPTTLPMTNAAATLRPTSIVNVPATAILPPGVTNTALPVNIVILSPVPGNVVAGSVSVFGAATHPQFLQYQIEYGPDPNPSQLWYPATGAMQQPVLNGFLGAWNTTGTPDGLYQIRLRVFMRDGTTLSTVVGNVRVQNRQPTPIPSATASVPRPIAAFTQDVTSGQVPLTVRFTNQSNGTFTSAAWNFGDGQSSSEISPIHTFNNPGLYNVTLTVTGPGGSSNVTRQINVLSPTAPVASFTQDVTTGNAPLTVRFTNQSTGNINNRLWNFSDGTTSSENNPTHTFNIAGTYNVFLTVMGPGGTSTVTRQFVVIGPPTATYTHTHTTVPPTATATATSVPATPTFTSTGVPPTATFSATLEPATATPTSTSEPSATSTATETPTFTPTATETQATAPAAQFSVALVDGLTVTFNDESQGTIDTYEWDFNGDSTIDSNTPGQQTFTYPATGTYTARLTVYNVGVPSAPFTLDVVVEDTPPAPGVIDNMDILPSVGNTSAASIYSLALSSQEGVQLGLIAIAGDEILADPDVLTPFADPNNAAQVTDPELAALVQFYNSNGAFAQPSTAANSGMTAEALHTAPGDCGQATQLACALAGQPAVMLISVGAHDVGVTMPADFEVSLNQIVQTVSDSGTIPILLTVPTLEGLDPQQVNDINQAIVNVAQNNNVPLLNTGRAINETTNGLMSSGNPADLTAAGEYGVNALNLYILQTLRDIIETVATGTLP